MKFKLRSRALGLALAGALSSLAAQAAPPPLALLGERFEVEATWRTPDGNTGSGTGASLTGETGYFWFFSPTNVEVVVKVLDACSGPSGHFWVFAGGLTDVAVELTVTDTASGAKKTYRNPPGTPFQPVQDTGAFATCGTARCGQETLSELAATPRADPELETLALFMGGRIAAPQAVYDRVVADVAVIRNSMPQLATLPFAALFDPQTLILGYREEVAPAVEAGTYHAWDCLNRWYGVEEVEVLPTLNAVFLHFRGVLDQRRLVADYQAVPGIASAQVNYFSPPPFPFLPYPLNSLCGTIEGTTHHYFARVGGSPIRYFTSQPGEVAVARGLAASDLAVLARAERCYNDFVPH